MPEQITLNPQIGSLFSANDFETFMNKLNANYVSPTNEYEIAKWKINEISIILYSKKIVIQTKKDPANYETVRSVCLFPGVIMDTDNKNKLSLLSPRIHNVMLCPTCHSQSRMISSFIEGIDIVFKHECKHNNNINSPILVLNNRILPDLNILVSNSLSRLIDMGRFDGFEIVIPKFAMRVAETLGGSKKLVFLMRLQD